MKIYDLELFLENEQGATDRELNSMLHPDAKFDPIIDEMHEDVIPTLEVMSEVLDRELILNGQRLYAHNVLTSTPIFEKIIESIAAEQGLDDLIEEGSTVEYEDIGKVPEGAFLFEDYHHLAVHVNKGGIIKQVDLMRPKMNRPADVKPVNKEFKKMMIKEFKTHEWEDITTLFFSDK